MIAQTVSLLFKIMPQMAASVWSFPILLLFLFVCSVFSQFFPTSFTRDELLDIRQHNPDNIFPAFDYSDVLFERSSQRASGSVQTGSMLTRWLSSTNVAS